MLTTISEYIEHIDKAINDSINLKSKLSSDIFEIDGMTGVYTKHFYNNICNFENCKYLEIGSWKGSSICSAICNNNIKATCIDNWCEFGGPKDICKQNLDKYKGISEVTLIEQDCFAIDKTIFPYKFNVYLYDGGHEYEHQYKAITYYYEVLDDISIVIIDDWMAPWIRDGTRAAFKDLNINILYEKEFIPTGTGTVPEEWWNGIYIGLIKK
jgi:hypothetical protein